VTEHINFHYGTQTVTAFVQVNFEKNNFEICMATNNGDTSAEKKWEWLFRDTVDVANFHIKSAMVINDTLVLTARGKPKQVFEQCCSFLMFFPLTIEDGLITKVSKDFNYLKLDPIVYPQLVTLP